MEGREVKIFVCNGDKDRIKMAKAGKTNIYRYVHSIPQVARYFLTFIYSEERIREVANDGRESVITTLPKKAPIDWFTPRKWNVEMSLLQKSTSKITGL